MYGRWSQGIIYNAVQRWIYHVPATTIDFTIGKVDKDTYLPFLLADPQLMECTQTSEDAPSKPAPIPTFGWVTWSVDFGLCVV